MNFSLRPKTLYRWMVLSRCLAAIFGGYIWAAASTVFLSLTLPLPRAEAVYLASLLSFLFFIVAVLWVFAARTAWGAWVGIVIPAALVVAVCYGLKAVGL